MPHKKAKNSQQAWEMQNMYEGKPHGWIQWKGTDVCMDVTCKCGHGFHIDADYAYHVKCGACGTVYMCSGYIELIELEEEPNSSVVLDDSFEDED